MKIGLIDMGSNTIRLCVYEIDRDRLERIYDKKIMAKLGGCMEADELTAEGIRRAVDAVNELRRTYTEPLDILRVFATASLRNAANSCEAAAFIEAETGLPIQLISGEEEALLSMEGAKLGDTVPPSGCIIDIGGGSTEVAVYEGNEARELLSLPIGSLNLRKGRVAGERPTPEEGKAIAEVVTTYVRRLTVLPPCPEMVGVGGTARTAVKVAALVFDPSGGQTLTREGVDELLSLLLRGDDTAIGAVEEAAPDRSRTLPVGLIILTGAMEALGAQRISVSKYGVREGFLIRNILADVDTGSKI